MISPLALAALRVVGVLVADAGSGLPSSLSDSDEVSCLAVAGLAF
jgi:hypothetical protein